MISIDGVNLIITLPSATSTMDAQDDFYEPWKEWVKVGDNAKYPPAFRTEGGSPVTATLVSGKYFFLNNTEGWRIRPAEEDATVNITGNLVPEDTTLPVVIPTIGTFRVLILGLQAITQGVTGITETLGADLTAVKAKTDQITFTKAGEVDSNIKSVNDTEVTGTGTPGDEWGPV